MLNSVHLIGRLGKDPELRYTPAGNPVAHFSLAVDDSYKKDAPPLWINIVVWNKPAEACHEFLKKGSLVFVGGRLSIRAWEDKDGARHTATEVIANTVQFLDSKPKSSDSDSKPPKKGKQPIDEEIFPF